MRGSAGRVRSVQCGRCGRRCGSVRSVGVVGAVGGAGWAGSVRTVCTAVRVGSVQRGRIGADVVDGVHGSAGWDGSVRSMRCGLDRIGADIGADGAKRAPSREKCWTKILSRELSGVPG